MITSVLIGIGLTLATVVGLCVLILPATAVLGVLALLHKA